MQNSNSSASTAAQQSTRVDTALGHAQIAQNPMLAEGTANLLLENSQGGLKCDSPTCDWQDMSISIEDYPKWLNAPCPKCGENVLTENDYNNVLNLLTAIDFMNSLSPQEIEELASQIDVEKLKETEMFKDAVGLENLSMSAGLTEISFETHGKLKVAHLKKVDE